MPKALKPQCNGGVDRNENALVTILMKLRGSVRVRCSRYEMFTLENVAAMLPTSSSRITEFSVKRVVVIRQLGGPSLIKALLSDG